MLHNSVPYSAYPCFLAETAESCAHRPSGRHCACMCNVMSYGKQWNLFCVNRINELLTASKRRIAPASDLWRRSSAGSRPCDEHTHSEGSTEGQRPGICKLGGSVHPAELSRTTHHNCSTCQQQERKESFSNRFKSHIQVILALKTLNGRIYLIYNKVDY